MAMAPPTHMTQQYCLPSMAAWLSSTSISHRSPPSHPFNPSLCSQQQPMPWDCSTIPNSSYQPLRLPGDQHSCPRYVRLWQGLILILFRLPQISCFTVVAETSTGETKHHTQRVGELSYYTGEPTGVNTPSSEP